jgi:hypothetical protein
MLLYWSRGEIIRGIVVLVAIVAAGSVVLAALILTLRGEVP